MHGASRDEMIMFLAESRLRQKKLQSKRQELQRKLSKVDCALAVMAVAETHVGDRAVQARQEEKEAWEGFCSSV